MPASQAGDAFVDLIAVIPGRKPTKRAAIITVLVIDDEYHALLPDSSEPRFEQWPLEVRAAVIMLGEVARDPP